MMMDRQEARERAEQQRAEAARTQAGTTAAIQGISSDVRSLAREVIQAAPSMIRELTPLVTSLADVFRAALGPTFAPHRFGPSAPTDRRSDS